MYCDGRMAEAGLVGYRVCSMNLFAWSGTPEEGDVRRKVSGDTLLTRLHASTESAGGRAGEALNRWEESRRGGEERKEEPERGGGEEGRAGEALRDHPLQLRPLPHQPCSTVQCAAIPTNAYPTHTHLQAAEPRRVDGEARTEPAQAASWDMRRHADSHALPPACRAYMHI